MQSRRSGSWMDEEAARSSSRTGHQGTDQPFLATTPAVSISHKERENEMLPTAGESWRHNDRRPASSHVARRRHARAKVKEVTQLLADLKPWQLSTTVILVGALAVTVAALYLTIENGIIGVVLFPFLSASESLDCGVVIDAGSHGTRAHLYSWPPRVHDVNHPISGPITYPSEIASCTTTPGVSSLAEEGTAEALIGPLISCLKVALVERNIPRDHWPTFPIFLRATAGMRDLDAETRSQIMNALRAYLSNNTAVPFAFQWNWARVTAGEEEGVYGWLTVNNILRTALLPAVDTVGALDMGGASIQITFSPVHRSVIEGYYGLNFGGQLIRLYSHSFLGYGWGDAIMRLSSKLAVEAILQFVNSTGGRMPYDKTREEKTVVRRLVETSSNSGTKTAQQPNLESTQTGKSVKLLNVTAFHPCYPKGHELQFAMPSLVYPDGRFFIDVDVESLRKYMASIGIPEDYVDSAFQRHRASSDLAAAKQLGDSATSSFVAQPAASVDTAVAWTGTTTESSTPTHGDGPVRADSAANILLSGLNRAGAKLFLADLLVGGIRMDNAAVADFLGEDPSKQEEYEGFGSVGDDSWSNFQHEDGGSSSKANWGAAMTLESSANSFAQLPVPGRRLEADRRNGSSNHHSSRDKLWKIAGTPVRVPLNAETTEEKRFLPLDAPFPSLAGPQVQWTINFIGTGDFDQCHARAKELFYNQPCFIHSCSFNGVYQPRLEGSNFVAFGQFSKITRALGLPPRASPHEIEESARKICKLSKTKLLELRKHQQDLAVYGKKGILNLCWKSVWASTVLHWGWKFPSNTSNVLFASSVGTAAAPSVVGWAAGSIFFEVNSLPWKMASGQFETPYFVLVIAVLLFATSCVLLLVQMRQYRRILNLVGLVPVPLVEGVGSSVRPPADSHGTVPSIMPKSSKAVADLPPVVSSTGASSVASELRPPQTDPSFVGSNTDYTLLPS